MPTPGSRLLLTPIEWTYVLGAAAIATLGFTTGSTSAILLAALLALPSSVVAAAAYYGAYGLLALAPGANPTSSAGSGSCTPLGDCRASSTGGLAAWFTITTHGFGILALTGAAVLDVIILRGLVAGRRARGQPPGTRSG